MVLNQNVVADDPAERIREPVSTSVIEIVPELSSEAPRGKLLAGDWSPESKGDSFADAVVSMEDASAPKEVMSTAILEATVDCLPSGPQTEDATRSSAEEIAAEKTQPRIRAALIHRHITGKDDKGKEVQDVPRDGHLLFITHEAFQRMGTTWPEEARHFELIIDETPEVVLTRQPFKLRDSHYILTSFLDVRAASTSPKTWRARCRTQAQAKEAGAAPFTNRDAKLMSVMEAILQKGSKGSSVGEVDLAKEHLIRLQDKNEQWERYWPRE